MHKIKIKHYCCNIIVFKKKIFCYGNVLFVCFCLPVKVNGVVFAVSSLVCVCAETV